MDELDWFKSCCSSCNEEKISLNWCCTCNAKRFQQSFRNWTSGNSDIDKFIQESQLTAKEDCEVLEWMPYERFQNVEYLASGGFGDVYKAKWIDGLIRSWDDKTENWERVRQNITVALKSLKNSKDVSIDFLREIAMHKDLGSAPIIRVYGITQDPKTEDYMMVLEFAEDGDLKNYLDQNRNLSWREKIRNMHSIALGLDKIHENKYMHRDLHIGNILMHNNQACVTDMGLCRPASDNEKGKVYGVIFYIAPEVLRNKGYSQESDIYSFGILMYQIISGLWPYHDRIGDLFLSAKICEGLRPKFRLEVPRLISDLMDKCLDGEPSNRPTAGYIKTILSGWWKEIEDNLNNPIHQSELTKQIKEAEKNNSEAIVANSSSQNIPKAIYTSRCLMSPEQGILVESAGNIPVQRSSDYNIDSMDDYLVDN